MADKLLPCPFCGGEAELYKTDFGFYVICPECMCSTQTYSTDDDAISTWNNRPSPWHTGTPTEEGWYLVAFNFHEGEIRYETWYYPNKLTWDNNNFGLLAWQRIEPPQEYDT